ncbi:MAG: hypothetical protein OFPI_38350 [Osedax symbiont Rs2]|nr:MAG: hypothetical protein OFPI_38350 [Osedax symbiont Rs2]
MRSHYALMSDWVDTKAQCDLLKNPRIQPVQYKWLLASTEVIGHL